ncbi:MAG: hypothetical protein WCD79_20720 [Chthoniobacteraceae bacterium]
MEVAFAVALFGAFAVVSILAYSSFNRFASNARYESLALAVAQQKMDQIMTSPCSINATNTALGPTLFLSGTTVQPTSSGSYASIVESGTLMTLNYDKWNMTRTITSGSLSNVALTGTLSGTTVAGAEDTQVIDSRTTTFAPVSGNPRLLSVSVTLAYTYRSRQFTLSLSSIRASDNF